MSRLLAFVLLGLSASAQDPTVSLRFAPPVGTVVEYVQTMVTDSTIPHVAKPVHSTMTTPSTLRVVSRQNGVTTIEAKTGQANLEVSPPDSPMAAMKADLERTVSGATTTASVDEHGEAHDTKLATSGPPSEFVRRLGAGLSKGFQGISYPSKPLKVGESWTSEVDMGAMLGATLKGMATRTTGKMTFTFRLVDVSNGQARIAFTMSGTTKVVGAKTIPSMTSTASGKGESTVDLDTGLARESTSMVDTAMTVGKETMRQRMVSTMRRR